MAKIGTLGDLVFEVSNKAVRTFDEWTQKTGGRWQVHEPIKSNPRPEFIGPGQGEISFTIKLSNTLGINPRKEIEKIEKIVREGTHAPLLLGLKPISDGDWYIESCETTFTWVNSKGEIEWAEMSLTVKEYF